MLLTMSLEHKALFIKSMAFTLMVAHFAKSGIWAIE